MPIYIYTPLASDEIRLLTIHPGIEGSRIRISLENTRLRPFKQVERSSKLPLRELQKTLPIGWTVYETLGGRNLFEHEETEITSWSHPVEDFDETLYAEAVTRTRSDSIPSFEALSYTWGVEDDSIEVDVVQQQELTGTSTETSYERPIHTCGAHEDFDTLGPVNQTALLTTGGSRGTLLLRPNLCTALQHLRYADRSRTIWIDAVCINQRDVQERNEQVRRMTDVYRSATRVIIWVGTAADNSSLALSSLKHLGHQLEWTRDNFALCHPDAVHKDWFRLRTELPFDDAIWRALESFLQRQWFERLWIWQEVHLASRDSVLQCGNDRIEWTLLRRAVRRLYTATSRLPLQFSTNFRSRLDGVDALVRNYSGVSFPRWIEIARKALCTDTRDRVYGLLGLAPPEYANVLGPDYTLPIYEVFKSAVVAQLSISDTLVSLCQCNLQQRFIESPSWVPDWSIERPTRASGTNLGFLASGRSSSCATYVSPSSLVTLGVIQGVVASTTSPCQEDQLLASVTAWAPPRLQESRYLTGENLEDAFLLTVCGGDVADYTSYPLDPTLYDLRSAFAALTDLGLPKTNVSASIADRVLSGFSRWIPGRNFITTQEGYIGLAPRGTQIGDVVSVLLGCPLPMVLRPNSEGKYEVVGSGYFHGLMHGEGILGALPVGWMCKAAMTDINLATDSFHNLATGAVTFDDPRLEPLSSEWRIETESEFSLCEIGEPRFVNQITGEVRKADPRMTPDAIKQRGMKLEAITLI